MNTAPDPQDIDIDFEGFENLEGFEKTWVLLVYQQPTINYIFAAIGSIMELFTDLHL